MHISLSGWLIIGLVVVVAITYLFYRDRRKMVRTVASRLVSHQTYREKAEAHVETLTRKLKTTQRYLLEYVESEFNNSDYPAPAAARLLKVAQVCDLPLPQDLLDAIQTEINKILAEVGHIDDLAELRKFSDSYSPHFDLGHMVVEDGATGVPGQQIIPVIEERMELIKRLEDQTKKLAGGEPLCSH